MEAQINDIQSQIVKVEQQIDAVERQIKVVEQQVEAAEQSGNESLAIMLRNEKLQLRDEELQLRDETLQLRDEELLLLRKRASRRVGIQSVRDGVPPLAHLRESSASTTGHAGAAIEELEEEFCMIAEIGMPRLPVMSLLWIHQFQTQVSEFSWKTEASIVFLVHQLLHDVLYECGLSASLLLNPDLGMFEILPNLLVLRAGGMPIGVVLVKKPSKGVLEHENVLGELYDFLLLLSNFHGAKQMIGIVTTYRQWRVCWLNDDETRKLMRSEAKLEPELEETTRRNASLLEKKDCKPPALTDYHAVLKEEDAIEEERVEKVGEAGRRKMFASRIWDVEKDNVFPLVASALLKMSRVKHTCFEHSFRRTLLRLNETSFNWDRLDPQRVESGRWDCVPNAATKNLYLLEDLGTGATGHVWLACSVGGAVCVLKFLANSRGNDAVLDAECEWWRKIYPHFGKYVRTAVFCNRKALVMPHFGAPKRDEATLRLVEDVLKTCFSSKGLVHPDVRWRNIGVYKDESGLCRAVIYDFDGVRTEQSNDGEWVNNALKYLAKSVVG